MKNKILPAVLLLLLPLFLCAAKPAPVKRVYTAARVNPAPPQIDGILDDPIWQEAEWSGDFIQRQPYEGKEPSQATDIKILYDDKNLYVAIRAFDSEPDRIERRMSRRDTIEGDWVEINIDSYFDKRTAFCFGVNAAGVKRDFVMSDDGESRDMNWDPIWHVKTASDTQGWTVEMRIPLSQLRFANTADNTWGLQVIRNLFRKDEYSNWQHIPRDASGWVHGFGQLKGVNGIDPPRQVEIVPYAVGKYQTFEAEEGNPFATGRDQDLMGGLDGKLGVTSDLTMNFTINPDFGQVEADPSVVNLTAYETYYEEKRPFFIEGRNLLSFPIMIGDGDASSDNLFYTRRIGAQPHRVVSNSQDRFALNPDFTSIIGAFKLTGKTRSGVSIGIIDSLTSPEYARISAMGGPGREIVEPLSNYFGLRLQKDYNQGKTFLGSMVTATHRNVNDPSLDFLHRAAYSGGVDFEHSWKNRTYFISIKTVFSHVRGSREALLRTQRSPLRYYQRPDAGHVTLDPNRVSLTGHGGTAYAAKLGNGHFSYMAGVTWRSPGLELNDMGYQRQADNIMQWTWASYRIWEPFFLFRSININFNQWRGWNFGGTNIFDGGNINLNGQFKNYWEMGYGLNRQFESLSPSALRGGPSLRYPGGWNLWYMLGTDVRKKWRLILNGSQFWGDFNNSRSASYTVGITFQPGNALNMMIFPTYSTQTSNLQYVTTRDFNSDSRYIMGRIDQKTLAVTLRLNYSLTPELSIQFYGQPFTSSGNYTEFKHITQARADVYADRYHLYTSKEIRYNSESNVYHVDETQNGETDYNFGNPNFDFLEFRSNLVLRWEYRPGSAVYLVWSQGRTGYDYRGEFDYQGDVRRLLDLPPHNVFLVKFSYCFQL